MNHIFIMEQITTPSRPNKKIAMSSMKIQINWLWKILTGIPTLMHRCFVCQNDLPNKANNANIHNAILRRYEKEVHKLRWYPVQAKCLSITEITRMLADLLSNLATDAMPSLNSHPIVSSRSHSISFYRSSFSSLSLSHTLSLSL